MLSVIPPLSSERMKRLLQSTSKKFCNALVSSSAILHNNNFNNYKTIIYKKLIFRSEDEKLSEIPNRNFLRPLQDCAVCVKLFSLIAIWTKMSPWMWFLIWRENFLWLLHHRHHHRTITIKIELVQFFHRHRQQDLEDFLLPLLKIN